MSTNNESEIISGLKSKERNSVRLFVDEYSQMILSTCLQFIPNMQDAEDITQNVFIKIFKSIDSFNHNSSFKTWIYRIAVTECLQSIRYQKRKKRFGFFVPIDDVDLTTGIDQLPDIDMEQKEQLHKLFEVIGKLPENQRVAFSLQNINDLSNQEIADIMETSVSSVESLLFRARKNLKEMLSSPQGEKKKGI